MLIAITVLEILAVVLCGYGIYRGRKQNANLAQIYITIGAVLFGIAGCIGLFYGITH
jgi:uncharacterized membrane protein